MRIALRCTGRGARRWAQRTRRRCGLLAATIEQEPAWLCIDGAPAPVLATKFNACCACSLHTEVIDYIPRSVKAGYIPHRPQMAFFLCLSDRLQQSY